MTPAPSSPTRHLARLWASLTPRRIAINLLVATLAAIALNPIFDTPFLSVWGRSIFVGLGAGGLHRPVHGRCGDRT